MSSPVALLLWLSNWPVHDRIYCLFFSLGCSKIIPIASALQLGSQTVVLVGKVGPADSNQNLQRRQCISTLTTKMATCIPIRKTLQVLSEIANAPKQHSAFRHVKHNTLLFCPQQCASWYIQQQGKGNTREAGLWSTGYLQLLYSLAWKNRPPEKDLDATAKPRNGAISRTRKCRESRAAQQDSAPLNSLEGLSADFSTNNHKYQGLDLSLICPHLPSLFTFQSVSVKLKILCN